MRLLLVAILVAAPFAAVAQETDGPTPHAVFFTASPGQLRPYAYLGPVGPYYPVKAFDRHAAGEAVLDCIARATGALDDCEVVSEQPRDVGFGPAAKRMAERHWIAAQPPFMADEPIRVVVPFRPISWRP